MKMRIYLLLLSCLCFVFAWSQSRQVTGRVASDSSGEALSGVTVTIKGTKSATTTNNEGRYSISIPDRNNVVLIFSYVGFQAQEINAGSKGVIDILMKGQTTTLNDVVVIGYQTVRRKDLLSSVSSVTSKQLRDVPLNSAEEALPGRLAGVQVTGSEGSPDAQVLIRVRGGGSITQDNAPLYVVDGIQVDNALSTLSPQDIESIDVLKDAAATSIYGARGANGVVIITTKGGKNTRGKTIVTYNGFAGINKLESELKVMDPYNYNLYQYERALQQNDTATLNNTYAEGIGSVKNFQQMPFYDWQKKMFGRNAFQQTHNVSVNGGTDITQYNLSVTENKQQGVMLGSDYDRKLLSFRFDHKVSDKVKIGFNTRYNNTEVNGAGTSNPGSSGLNFLRQVVRYRPYLSNDESADTFDPDYYNLTNGNGLNLVNPILLNDAQYRNNDESVLNLSAYFNYNLTRFLSFRSTLGYDNNTLRANSFDYTLTNNSISNGAKMPIASINSTAKSTIDNSNVFTYSNAMSNGRFKEHNDLDAILGEETYQTHEKDYYVETRYFPLGITPESALGNMNLGTPPNSSLIEPKPTSADVTTTQLSFFSRINYTRDKKYLASLSFRADGSSLFASQNRWGYFPSGSLAWRISREDFMSGVKFINDMKVRASYGEAGNNRITPYLYLTQFNSNSQYGLNDVLTTGYIPAALTNQNLKWETTVSRNLGLDASMFNDRLSFSIDVYNNATRDLLVAVPVPSTSGYTTQIQNVGSTSNKGVEVQLNGAVMQKRAFNWTANFNISFNKNKITSLGSQTKYLQNSGWAGSNNPPDFIVKVGEEVGTMYGLVNDGFYTLNDFDYNAATRTYILKAGVPNAQGVTSVAPQPGGIKFRDLNGDGIISSDSDRTVIGHAQPKFFGGLTQQFTYKNFDFSIFINFQYGNKVYNFNKLEFTSGYSPGANLLAFMNNRWRTIDDNGVVYQQVKNGAVIGASPDSLSTLNKNASIWMPLVGASASSFQPQSWAVEDASFIRINNITLGYTLPSKITKRIKISRLRVYATVNNVAVITGYSGYDPEVSTRRSTPVTPGVDYSAYPRSRSYVAGINLNF